MTQTTFIAIGSNQPIYDHTTGNRLTPKMLVKKASARLANVLGVTVQASKYYVTPCFPVGAGPDFVNATLSFQSNIPPADLLPILHEIEAEFDRLREVRWGPRTLDLDLLAVGDLVLPDLQGFTHWRDLPIEKQTEIAPDQLILPHPRMQDRAFVLVPLCDIAPDWVHPVLGKTVQQMCDMLPKTDIAAVVPLDG